VIEPILSAMRLVPAIWSVYVVLLHVLVIGLLSGRGRRFVPSLRDYDESIKVAHFQAQMRSFHKRIDESAKPGSVVFVGASGVQGLNLQRFGGVGLNLGIGGDTSEGVLERLPTYRSIGGAEAVVLAIGFNDLKLTPEETTAERIGTIVDTIPEDVHVVVCAVCPIDETKGFAGYNERIRRLNAATRVVVEGKGSVTFLEFEEHLVGAFGSDYTKFLEVDGVHLNAAGRDLWIDVVASCLSEILGIESKKE